MCVCVSLLFLVFFFGLPASSTAVVVSPRSSWPLLRVDFLSFSSSPFFAPLFPFGVVSDDIPHELAPMLSGTLACMNGL